MIRTYSELSKIPDFLGRYRYLKLDSKVGEETFAFDRYLNQRFYHSAAWKRIRNQVITRDSNGDWPCDLGVKTMPIGGLVIIHHMNPIDIDDIKGSTEFLLNPEYLIAVSWNTHQAIHYGDESLLMPDHYEPRSANDTAPWRK